MKPSIFIGSSTEGLSIAQAIQLQLDRIAEVTVWTDNVFGLSASTYDALERQLRCAHYGIFVLSADDIIRSRGKQRIAPRDNVVFELGLFAGKLGLRRTFIVHPRQIDIRIPTDLLGITMCTYELHSSGNITASLGVACTQMRSAIEADTRNGVRISWEQVCDWVKELASLLKRGPSRGGFTFDVIVGITGGGLIIADLLSRCYGRQQPVISLWADRHSHHPVINFAPPSNWVNGDLFPIFSNNRVRNILVVDVITRTGTTVVQAKKFLKENLPDKNVKNAVLIADATIDGDIDYCIARRPTQNLLVPFSELDS